MTPEETRAGAEDADDATGEFLTAIFDDVRVAESELKEGDTPFRRRNYVRATFSSVEGFIYVMKKVALMKPQLFTVGELAMLREEAYFLTSKGEVREQSRSPPMADNLRFAFLSFMRFHGSAATLEADVGWQKFGEAIRIRNRVTHPKCTDDLRLRDADVETVRLAAHWLATNVAMAVIETLGAGAVAAFLLFLLLWGLARRKDDQSIEIASPERPETD